MEPRQENLGYRWYLSSAYSWRRALVLSLVPIAITTFLSFTSLREEMNDRFLRPVEFWARHRLGRDPELDPRIKIYALDDSTISYLQREELTIQEWLGLFKAIEPLRPRVVLVDKAFGTPTGLEKLGEITPFSYPIVSGVFLPEVEVPNRISVDLNRPEFELRLLDPARSVSLAVTPMPVYGSTPALRPWFSRHGHFNYAGVRPMAFYRVGPTTVIPHMSFLAAKEWKIENGKPIVDGREVPVTRDGRMMINLSHPSIYVSKTYALRSPLKRIREGEPLPELPPDGVVVILPGMSTGDTDVQPTPFGILPGGYLQTALINSAVTGKWLRVFEHDWVGIVLLGLLGGFLGWKLSALLLVVSLLAGTAVCMGGSLLLFAYQSVEVSWILPIVSYLLAGLATIAEKVRRSEDRTKRLRQALDGVVSPQRMVEILKQPGSLALEPAERVVSILFVDIAGFSLMAEHQTPREAFLRLKEMLRFLTEVVHRHGGVVDKTLGDGMLCFFGYTYDKTETYANHAEVSVRCASQMQRELLKYGMSAMENGEPIYLARMGINTAPVYIGDLGNPLKLDLTLIGDGVNFAKRMESACEPQRVLMSSFSYVTLSSQAKLELKAKKKKVEIKHHDEAFDSYEVTPLRDSLREAKLVREAQARQKKALLKKAA